MDVTIVIPVFNQAQYTKLCLDTLRAGGMPEARVVVVDNGSTDETAALLAARPALCVIRNSANRGCGGAWNQGARSLPAAWTVLLNNDVLLPPGWIEGLVAFAEQERCEVVSPAICHGEQDYDFAGHARDVMQRMVRARRRGVASGVCFMVHRSVFDAIGYFDEDPRLGGYEDDEFFRRARKAGFRLATTGRSFLHHFGSMTQKAIKAQMGRPDASLGDREYYRKKIHQTWFERQRGRFLDRLLKPRWRIAERLRYGCTLVSRRENGAFIWQ